MIMQSREIRSSRIVLAALLVACCGDPRPASEVAPIQQAATLLDAQAHYAWFESFRVIEAAAVNLNYDQAVFDQAARFFEETTRITVPFSHSYVASTAPTRQTITALAPLRSWYAANGHRLYWDEEAKKVKVRPQ